MKRIIAMTLSLALALSMCGCKSKDKKEDKKTSATSVEFHEISPEAEPKEKFDVEITDNTFTKLSEFTTTHNHSSVFFANIMCKAPDDIADGIYSSPDVKATVNGKSFDKDNLSYIYVSQGRATITVTFFAGYVKKDDEISVTIKNFNKLNEPEEDGAILDYSDISDEVVLEGALTIKTVAKENFGFYKYDLSDINGEEISLVDSSASIKGANGIFGKTPDVNAIVVVLDNNEEITFDFFTQTFITDAEGNPTEKYDLVFMFEDTKKTIDLSKVTDIKINGESIVK